ncbi:response regulator, partial [Acinetobacter baumannii]|nr:response regulator [Acinetobacter baumannii]
MKEKEVLKDTDIFILDIKMYEVSGMDLAKIIRKENEISEIIFVTSLVAYVQEGYTVRAYRYLLKPINYEELKTN